MSGEWLELAEAAQLLGVHPSTLRRWADAGKVPHQRTLSGRRRFTLAGLDQARMELRQVEGLPHPSRVDELEIRTLEKTRERTGLLYGEQAAWSKSLSEEQRILFRYSGRRLLDLVLHFLQPAAPHEDILQEGRQVAQDYGKVCCHIGLTLPQTVEAFLFFRRSILESAQTAVEIERFSDRERFAMFLRAESFFDALLVTTVETYQQSAGLTQGGNRGN